MKELTKLEQVAHELNKVSDELTASMIKIEQAINKLGVGLEVWRASALPSGAILGYARLHNGFGFVIKDVNDDKGKIKPLIRASRLNRIEAYPFIPEIVELLVYKSQQVIQQIIKSNKEAEDMIKAIHLADLEMGRKS